MCMKVEPKQRPSLVAPKFKEISFKDRTHCNVSFPYNFHYLYVFTGKILTILINRNLNNIKILFNLSSKCFNQLLLLITLSYFIAQQDLSFASSWAGILQ